MGRVPSSFREHVEEEKMSRRTLTWAGVAALAAILVLVLVPAVVMAKKPVKPPPEPEPDSDPAIAFVQTFKFDVEKVMVMNADGSNVTVAFDGEGAEIGRRVDWSPNGERLLSADDFGTLRLWESVTESWLCEFAVSALGEPAVLSIDVRADDRACIATPPDGIDGAPLPVVPVSFD